VAKTRGGVRRIISSALKGKALIRDRTFIGFNCEELYLAKINSIRIDESLAFCD